MSWGFFLDLRCELPTKAAWTALKKQKPAVQPAGWSGFAEKGLLAAFEMPDVLAKNTFAKHLGGEDVTVTVDETSVRVFAHRDRSALDFAGVLASLLDAVADAGGSGELALVNDGTYSGEDGVLIKRKAGGKRMKPKALKDYEERLEALTAEVVGEFGAHGDGADAEGRATGAADTRSDGTVFTGVRDPITVGNAAFEVYKTGDKGGARRVVELYFDEGGERSAYLVRMYGILLRDTLGSDAPEDRERALDRLLGAFDLVPAHRSDAAIVVEAVAAGNENGRSLATIELVLQGLREGLVLTAGLTQNTTNSGCKLKDAEVHHRLADALLPLLGDDSPIIHEGVVLVARAELRRWKGDKDGAFASLEAAFEADPTLRESVRSEPEEWPGYVEDPRWKRIVLAE